MMQKCTNCKAYCSDERPCFLHTSSSTLNEKIIIKSNVNVRAATILHQQRTSFMLVKEKNNVNMGKKDDAFSHFISLLIYREVLSYRQLKMQLSF